MECEHCQQPATIHITRVIDGEKKELHLCSECAAEQGFLSWAFEPKFPIGGMLDSLLGQVMDSTQGQQRAATRSLQGGICPNCGRTLEELSQTGFVGCEQCYRTFRPALQFFVGRIHGPGVVHHGKQPPQRHALNIRSEGSLHALRSELQTMITEENYERAAEIRDQIRRLEAEEHE